MKWIFVSNQDTLLPPPKFPKWLSWMCHRDVKNSCFRHFLLNKRTTFLAGSGDNTSRWCWACVIQAQRLLGILIQVAPPVQEQMGHQNLERPIRALGASKNVAPSSDQDTATWLHQEKQIKLNFAESRFEHHKWFVHLPWQQCHYICLKKFLCSSTFKLQFAAHAVSFSPDVKIKLISQQKCTDCCPWTMCTTPHASLADATWSPTRGNKALQGNRNWRCTWDTRNAP